MNVTAPLRTMAAAQAVEHFDVLIVGAGISGVGSAYHLTKQLPDTTFVVLEEQESYGGPWWPHKYPGIRSDSDLPTLGYSFKPWTGPPIATAAEIRAYMARGSTRTISPSTSGTAIPATRRTGPAKPSCGPSKRSIRTVAKH